jgi:hypothetical protein
MHGLVNGFVDPCDRWRSTPAEGLGQTGVALKPLGDRLAE